MAFPDLRYEPYEASAALPNVVVDGSPNAGTVLTLTHWPGIPVVDPALADDLSAQMAFRYVERGARLHGDAAIVTNNHFDQDGLVGVFALAHPELALPHRRLLEDVAAAGDFATFSDRRAAHVSMVLSAWSQTQGDPYPHALERLPSLIDDLDSFRDLWEQEDADLRATEEAIASGAVRIDEEPDLDLAVVTTAVGPWSGHRFGGRRFDGLHPMALHNATERTALLLIQGSRYVFTYRYETWVQLVSRTVRSRVALEPLAHALGAIDDVRWHADGAGDLTPQLSHDGESSLAPDVVIARVREHLATSPPAWDPRVGRRAGG